MQPNAIDQSSIQSSGVSTPTDSSPTAHTSKTHAALSDLTSALKELKPIKPPRASNLALIVAILGLLVSVAAQLLTIRSTTDQSVRDSVERSYSTWLQVSKMQLDYPDLAHMFALPHEYDQVVAHVRTLNNQLPETERARLLLRERGVAVFLFTMYEASLYQQTQAKKTLDPRGQFYGDVVQYFEEKPLRNPRLIWWWSNGVSSYFEISTQERYQANVLNAQTNQVDAVGPFGGY